MSKKEVEASIERLPGDLREVAEIIGLDKTLALVERFGGAYIRVPRCEGLLREIRDNSIRALYDAGGCTVRSLAVRFRLTDRRISDILNNTNSKIPQPLLTLLKKN